MSYIIVCEVFSSLLPPKAKGMKRFLLQFVFGAGLLGFMALSDGIPQALFLPCMACCLTIMFGQLWFCCDMPALNTGCHCRGDLWTQQFELCGGKYALFGTASL